MGRKLLFNCNKIKATSESLRTKEEEFNNLRKRLISLSASMKEDWQGEDAKVFFSKFDYYIEHLESISAYLNDKSLLFEKASELHSKYDTDLDDKIRRRLPNEQ